MNHEHLSSGDVVVGQYMENGKQAKKGVAADDEEGIKKYQEMMQRSATSNGGSLLVPKNAAKGIKAKPVGKPKKTNKEVEPLTPLLTAVEIANERPPIHTPTVAETVIKPLKKKQIYLHNKLGRIKMKAIDVLNSNMAFGLMFESEDDIVLEPNPGEELTFVDADQNEYSVYYPNVLFDLDNGNKLMILFKNSEEEQEEGAYD